MYIFHYKFSFIRLCSKLFWIWSWRVFRKKGRNTDKWVGKEIWL